MVIFKEYRFPLLQKKERNETISSPVYF